LPVSCHPPEGVSYFSPSRPKASFLANPPERFSYLLVIPIFLSSDRWLRPFFVIPTDGFGFFLAIPTDGFGFFCHPDRGLQPDRGICGS